MRYRWRTFSGIVSKSFYLSIILLAVAVPNRALSRSFSAKVIYIVDGDTVEILWKQKIQRVRIWGIDTPEWDQPYSMQSKELTRKMLAGKTVEVFPKDVDKFGRLVARIIADHASVSRKLVESGLAWVHIYYCKEPVCDRWKILQKRAMAEHKGLWNDPHPIAPWQWKRTHKR
jgi:endonuclease YncB( thermonuclease family)